MKIVVAVHHFPPQYRGGAELRGYRTASWLVKRGHEVRVVCVEEITSGTGDGLTFADEVYDGLPVRRLRFNLAAAPDPFQWSYDNRWVGEHMRSYLGEWSPDVLHLISGYLMSGSVLRAAREQGIPAVVTLTDFWFLCPRVTLLRSSGQLCQPPFDAVTCARCLGEERRRYRLPGRLAPGVMGAYWRRQMRRVAAVQARMAYLGEVLQQVDALIAPSQFLRGLFVEAGVAPERVLFSRQGRDFSGELSQVPGTCLRVGYMGQIAPHKGVHTLFEAVRLLPEARLEVRAYGDVTRFPRYAQRLRRLAAQDRRLQLAGTYEGDEVSRVLRELDVVVVPSVWYENSPNTILEAFAHGTPVVVSDLGGMAELVAHDVDGLRFVPGDASSLAAQLQRLVQEPDLLSRLRAGIQPVRSVEAEMVELEGVYDSLLGMTGPSR